MTTEVVTVLRVSAEQPVEELKRFESAMNQAAGTNAKFVQQITESPRSVASIGRAYEKLHTQVDPVFAAQVKRQKEIEKAFQTAHGAVSNGLATYDQAAAVVKKVSDHQNALVASANSAAFAQTTLGRAVNGVSGQLIALSAGAGPVGTFLAALGPWGVAAGVGLSAAATGLAAASGAAHNFAADMLRVRDTAQSLGLSTTQFQAIADVGSKFALSEQQVGAALSRFTAQMDDFRKGQGELFKIVQSINPALAKEMAQSRDTATAIDLLAKAYENAGTSRQKLDRLIGGRGGGGIGLLFQELGNGGLDSAEDAIKKAGDAIEQQLIAKIAVLKAEIDDMSADASRNLASIFSLELMQAQHSFAETILEISRTLKAFSITEDFKTFVSWTKWLAENSNPFVNGIKNLGALFNAFKGAQLYNPADPNNRVDPTFVPPLPTSRPGAVPLPSSRPTSTIDRDALLFDINTLEKTVSLMGAAATSADKYRLQRLKLDLAIKDGEITQRQATAALGEFGKELSQNDLAKNAALLAKDAQFGAASAAKVYAQNLAELNLVAKERKFTDEQYANGLLVIARNTDEAIKRNEILIAQLPQLKQLELNAGDVRLQLDKFGTDFANSFGTAFTDIATGSKTAAQAFQDLERAIIRSLMNMVAQMLIVAPIAKMLQSILGALMPGGGSTQNAGGMGFWGFDSAPAGRIESFSTPRMASARTDMAPKGDIYVTVHEGASDTTRATKRKDGNDTLIEVFTKRSIALADSGKFNNGIKQNFGAQELLVSR